MFQISEETKSSGIQQRHNGSSKLHEVSGKCSYYNPIAEESLHQNIENTSTDISSTQTSAESRLGSFNALSKPSHFNIRSLNKIGPPSSAKSTPKSPPPLIEEPINCVDTPCQCDVTTMIRIMKQQLRVLEKGEAWVYDKMNEDDVIEEWQKVALIVDRFFMIVFLIIMIATSSVISIKLYSQI